MVFYTLIINHKHKHVLQTHMFYTQQVDLQQYALWSNAGRWKNLGLSAVKDGQNLPLVGIRLTHLPKIGGSVAPLTPRYRHHWYVNLLGYVSKISHLVFPCFFHKFAVMPEKVKSFGGKGWLESATFGWNRINWFIAEKLSILFYSF